MPNPWAQKSLSSSHPSLNFSLPPAGQTLISFGVVQKTPPLLIFFLLPMVYAEVSKLSEKGRIVSNDFRLCIPRSVCSDHSTLLF